MIACHARPVHTHRVKSLLAFTRRRRQITSCDDTCDGIPRHSHFRITFGTPIATRFVSEQHSTPCQPSHPFDVPSFLRGSANTRQLQAMRRPMIRPTQTQPRSREVCALAPHYRLDLFRSIGSLRPHAKCKFTATRASNCRTNTSSYFPFPFDHSNGCLQCGLEYPRSDASRPREQYPIPTSPQ